MAMDRNDDRNQSDRSQSDRSQSDRVQGDQSDRGREGMQGSPQRKPDATDRDEIGRGADVPDSTQVPWNAERGEPDMRTQGGGMSGAQGGQRDQSSAGASEMQGNQRQRGDEADRDRTGSREQGSE